MKIPSNALLKGIAWTVGFFTLGQLVRIVSSVVLTRILTPEIFGTLVIVYVLRNGIDLFSDVGLTQSIVVNKNAEELEFYNTVWSLRLVRSLLIFPCCIAAAFPLAGFYKTPMLVWILPVVGIYFVVEALASLSVPFLQKRLQTAKLNFFQFIVEIITASSQIVFAFLSPTVWALVLGALASAAANSIGSYFLIPNLRHHFYISKQYTKQIVVFGKWIFISSIIFFFASNFDNLYFGKIFPLELLGVYGIARNIAEAVTMLLARVNSAVIFPFIASHSELSRTDFRQQVNPIRARFLLVAAAGFSVFVASADLLVHTLYDQRYQDAGWMLSVMLIGRWFWMLCYINESSLIGFGKPVYSAYSVALKFSSLLIGLPLVFTKYGIVSAIAFVAFSETFRYIALLVGQIREGFSFVRQDIGMTLLMLALVGIWEWLRMALGLGITFGRVLT